MSNGKRRCSARGGFPARAAPVVRPQELSGQRSVTPRSLTYWPALQRKNAVGMSPARRMIAVVSMPPELPTGRLHKENSCNWFRAVRLSVQACLRWFVATTALHKPARCWISSKFPKPMAIKNFAKFSLVVLEGRIYTFNGFTRCMKYCALVDVASHSKTYVPADTLVDLNS